MPNFEKEKSIRIKNFKKNKSLLKVANKFTKESLYPLYSYNFNWLGRPIIQYPQDIIALQEIIWNVRPDLIIETGIARGGSLIFSSSMLSLLDTFQSKKANRKVIGIDIDIRIHNKKALEKHPFSKNIKMIEGSSIDSKVLDKVKKIAKNFKKILVFLDSNHTHEHVYEELNLYTPFVSKNSYCVVFDTIVEDLPKNYIKNRPWNKGNNPKTAIKKFLKINKNFKIDNDYNNKLLISMNPDGYLKKFK